MRTNDIYFILVLALFPSSGVLAQNYSFEISPMPSNPDILEVSATFLPDTEYSITDAEEQMSSKMTFNMLLGSGEWLMQKEDDLTNAESFFKSMIVAYKNIADIADLKPYLDDASYQEAFEEYSANPDILNSYAKTYEMFYLDTRILGIIRYGDYDLILSENKSSDQFFTQDMAWTTVIRDENNNYRTTDLLESDIIWQWLTIDRGPFWDQFIDQLRELNGIR